MRRYMMDENPYSTMIGQFLMLKMPPNMMLTRKKKFREGLVDWVMFNLMLSA